jgi:alpha-glucosidase (family GH31 glycosyl hydrolase)
MQAKNAFEFLKTKGRPFMVTRSNTLGSSRFAIHWTGDNYANFTFLRLSIVSNFMLGMWGEQMVGSDICGFGGNATE